MKADTKTVGAKLVVTHNPPSWRRGVGCNGATATVTEANARGFLAQCDCGWRFAGMHTDGYNSPASERATA
jgi:hypothetical protein